MDENKPRPRAIDIWPDGAELLGITNRSSAYEAAANGFMGPLIETGARRRKVSRDWLERKVGGTTG